MEFKPHAYQQYCVDKLMQLPYAGLFLDMGLGKTVTTLTAIQALKYDCFAVHKVLIVAPKKVAEATWQAEIAKWAHLQNLTYATVLGSATKRQMALARVADVYIINRENVEWLVDFYGNAFPFDMVVLDESSSFKNPASKRWKALKRVRPKINRLVLLTGTPAPNAIMDLWAQIYLLDTGERLGKTLGGFRERYFKPDKRNAQQIFSYAPKEGTADEVKRRIGDLCISMQASDYLQLPEKVTVQVPIALDDKGKKAYTAMERDLLLTVDDQTITAQSAAVLTGKLLQIASGAIYDETHTAIPVHDCKLQAFTELIDSLGGQPSLVFYQFQHEKERIVQALHRTGVRIYQNRQDADDWNAGKITVLLAHPASTAYGLNLQQGGNHVIWFSPTWSLELYQQANARLHRQGQTSTVIVHHLVVQGSMDEDVLQALDGKAQVQDGILQALKARISRLSTET